MRFAPLPSLTPPRSCNLFPKIFSFSSAIPQFRWYLAPGRIAHSTFGSKSVIHDLFRNLDAAIAFSPVYCPPAITSTPFRRFSQDRKYLLLGLIFIDHMTISSSVPCRSYSRRAKAASSKCQDERSIENKHAETEEKAESHEDTGNDKELLSKKCVDTLEAVKQSSNSDGVCINDTSSVVEIDQQSDQDEDEKPFAKKRSDRASAEKKPTTENRAEDTEDLHVSQSTGSLEGEFEAWLTAVDQCNRWATLTVVDLREILIKIGRPSVGRKQDLILEVKKFLVARTETGLLQDKASSPLQVKTMKACKNRKELQQIGPIPVYKQAQVIEVDKQDQIVEEENKSICSLTPPEQRLLVQQTVVSLARQEQNQMTEVESKNMDGAASPELPTQLQSQAQLLGLVSDTEVRLDKILPHSDEQPNVSEKEKTQIFDEASISKMIEADISTSQTVELVYTRRSRRKLVTKQNGGSVEELTNHGKKEMDGSLEDSTKVSLPNFQDMALSGQNVDRIVHDQPVTSEVVTPPKKRRLVVKGPRPPEPEEIVSSKSQETEFLLNKEEPWTVLVHRKIQPDWIAYNPATMRPDPPAKGIGAMKLLSWNVNGLRALLKRKSPQQESPILQLAQREDFDVLCLQETKLQEKDATMIKQSLLPGYDNSFWNCSTAKLGYSGTAVISRIKPLSVIYGLGIINHDNEGRLITLEFDTFYLVAGYIPNSGQKLERLAFRTQEWDLSLSNHVKELEKRKPVILTGDLNCAHQEIDIFNPDGNRRSAGFTDEERASFEVNFLKKGLVDTFRQRHPNAVAYTYWGYRTASRSTNSGWRLDYFLVSHGISRLVHDSYTLPDVDGSDHCPIGLIIKV